MRGSCSSRSISGSSSSGGIVCSTGGSSSGDGDFDVGEVLVVVAVLQRGIRVIKLLPYQRIGWLRERASASKQANKQKLSFSFSLSLSERHTKKRETCKEKSSTEKLNN